MKILIGGKYLIHPNRNMGKRIGIEIVRIDHIGFAYFREYPYKEPAKIYCDKLSSISKIASLWTPAVSVFKIINKRRTSAFKPR